MLAKFKKAETRIEAIRSPSSQTLGHERPPNLNRTGGQSQTVFLLAISFNSTFKYSNKTHFADHLTDPRPSPQSVSMHSKPGLNLKSRTLWINRDKARKVKSSKRSLILQQWQQKIHHWNIKLHSSIASLHGGPSKEQCLAFPKELTKKIKKLHIKLS